MTTLTFTPRKVIERIVVQAAPAAAPAQQDLCAGTGAFAARAQATANRSQSEDTE